ncbi:MAG: CinA family protein [Deltaproteobacteria bacterium]|jgi:PncC family amidohydrolase|nr:CinA family protein [Deltaproteobacteria bacterium]
MTNDLELDNLAPTLKERALDLGPRLIRLGATIGVAESLTGGLVSTILTYVPGSSAFFLGGVTAYANLAKELVLKVDPIILKTHGAVSSQTAVAMAKGIKNLLGADIGLATTGIAGPDGGTPNKPVGLYYVAALDKNQEICLKMISPGSRHQVTRAATLAALNLLEELINSPILA